MVSRLHLASSTYDCMMTTTYSYSYTNNVKVYSSSGDTVHATNASVLEAGENSSRYTSGWGSRFDSRRAAAVATSDGRSYEEIRAQCLKDRKPFEDPDFPAKDSSIFFSRSPPRPFQWKRPRVSSVTILVRLQYIAGCIIDLQGSMGGVVSHEF